MFMKRIRRALELLHIHEDVVFSFPFISELSGGALLTMLTKPVGGRNFNDIDIFFRFEGYCKEKMMRRVLVPEISDVEAWIRPRDTEERYWDTSPLGFHIEAIYNLDFQPVSLLPSIQFIQVDCTPSRFIEESFDISILKNYYNGQRLVVNNIWDLANETFTYKHFVLSRKERIAKVDRVAKYIQRGYTFVNGDKHALDADSDKHKHALDADSDEEDPPHLKKAKH